MIPFKNRFHGHNSLTYVYRNGQTIRSHLISLRAIANPHRKESRIAIVVSKKVLKSAVRRNRIRRRLYEYVRLKLPSIDGVHDIVFIVSSSDFLNISQSDMSLLIDHILNQAGLLNKNTSSHIKKPIK